MSDLYWLTEEQMARLRPYFPKSHGKPRVDNKRVLSGIVFVNRNGLRWRDAPSAYGPHKTLCQMISRNLAAAFTSFETSPSLRPIRWPIARRVSPCAFNSAARFATRARSSFICDPVATRGRRTLNALEMTTKNCR
ncbi:transposase [Sphingomonas faeni]|uniref:transposase n=1 Tax=Sphingomonas faeni TaxID=185950 RepID=UPI00336520D2